MIEIKNLARIRIKKNFFEKIGKTVFSGEKKDGLLSLVILSPREIKKINRFFKKNNKPTDVLSFLLKDDSLKEDPPLIGEVFICPEFIRRSSAGQADYQKELTLAFIHGILHLLGYDHKKQDQYFRMRKKENFYLKKFFNL